MDPDSFYNLLSILQRRIGKQDTTFRKCVPAETRLAVCLRYLSQGDCFHSIAQGFRVGESTVRGIVHETTRAIIAELGHEYMRMPTTPREWRRLARRFEERWNMPNTLGAIDGKHVRIVAPPASGSVFYNYKDFFSVVLMAVAGPDYEFVYVDVGAEGRLSDASIWKQSSLNKMLHDKKNPLGLPQPRPLQPGGEPLPYYMISDDAFRLSEHVIKPFKGLHLSRQERIFNYRLSRARRVVENAFGILTARFRLLRRAVEVQGPNINCVVMAACLLHNYMRRHSSSYIGRHCVDHETIDGQVVPGSWRQHGELQPVRRNRGRSSDYSKFIRHTLTDHFTTPQGEVHWQYEAIGN